MNKSDLSFFLNQNVQIELSNFILSLFCAAVLSFVVHLFYVRFSTTLSNRIEFSKNFVVLGVATCIVIMIVKSSLALSLGLVGALSIVRFRAAVKDPLDIIFMFWSISVGIANGVANLKVSFTATLVIAVIILLLSKLPAIKPAKILIIKINPSKENELFNLFKSSKTKFKLKSRSQKESYLELIGEIRLQDDDAILNSINSLDSSVETNLISYNSNILDV